MTYGVFNTFALPLWTFHTSASLILTMIAFYFHKTSAYLGYLIYRSINDLVKVCLMFPCLSDLKRENTKGLLFLFFFCILKLICVETENEGFNSFTTVVISYDPELDCNQFFFLFQNHFGSWRGCTGFGNYNPDIVDYIISC